MRTRLGVRKLAECDGPASCVRQGAESTAETVRSPPRGINYPLGVAPPAPASPAPAQQQDEEERKEKDEEGAIETSGAEDTAAAVAAAAEIERQQETADHLTKVASAAAATERNTEGRSGPSLIVVGGTGRLGQAVVNRVLEQQRFGRVRVLVRPGSNAAEGGLQATFPQAVRTPN